MPQMIFVNIPVTDVARSRSFFQALGYTINEQFSDHSAACVVVSETIYFMILNHERFQGFATKPMADPATSTAVIVALSQEDRAAVDQVVAAALAAGGSESKEAQDMGFMYLRAFQDPDGNAFEVFWMDPAAAQG
jgi:predicted lactoylglutathione lyase